VILLLRALVKLLAFLLLVALALLGLAAAVFCLQGGSETLSLTKLADLLRLPELRDEVGDLLRTLEADGPLALLSLLGGLIAMLAGLALLAGVLVPRRERLVTLEAAPAGTLAARRRALAAAAGMLAEQARGVTAARVRARPRRTSGGTLRVRAQRTRSTDTGAARAAVEDQLRPLTDPFKLRSRVQVRFGGRGPRVQ
jgi:hypothetical protein